jgi:hypothetical protein
MTDNLANLSTAAWRGRPRPFGRGLPCWSVWASGRSRGGLVSAQSDLPLGGNPTQVAPAEE